VRRCLGFVVSLALFACTPAPSGPPISWESDLEGARARAKALHQPVIVGFGAQWCGACERLQNEVWPDPKVRGAAARFVAVHVDLTDADADAAASTHTKRYGVESLPTVLFIDSHGELLESPRLRTYLPPHKMRQMLQAIP
jgi:thiol:disulfide interchange protein